MLVDVITLSKRLCEEPIRGNLAYAGEDNFVGRIIEGYSSDSADLCLLSPKAANALCEVQIDLKQHGVGLFVYDAYRPLRAVNDFASWCHSPVANPIELIRKEIHYPSLFKEELLIHGYLAYPISRHNYARSVDVVLVDLESDVFLDMGACFDLFDSRSHLDAPSSRIGEQAVSNRLLLTTHMKKRGFLPYIKEYWHFDYHEVEVNDPLDIPIDSSMKWKIE